MLRICVLLLSWTCCLYLASALWAQPQPPAKNPGSEVMPGKAAPEKAMPDKTIPDKTIPDKTAPDKAAAGKPAAPGKEPLVAYTYDGVRIDGDYYPVPESKGKTAPCVILVHAVGLKNLNASRADWGKFPERLQQQGYAVAAIDLRGYGKSKTVEEVFWRTHRPRSRSRDTIEARDHSTPVEMMEMLYDLTAVKIWLNTKNNSKECNSKAIGVIGLEQGGLLALAWAANEHSDPQRAKQRAATNLAQGGFGNPGLNHPGVGPGFGPGIGPGFGTGFGPGIGPGFGPLFGNPGFNPPNNQMNPPPGNNALGNATARMEGEDIVCILPISTANRLNEPLSMGLLERWITYTRDRQVALMAIYGTQDKDANTFWSKASTWVRPAGDKFRYKNNGTKPIKTSLAGAKLLSNDTLDVPKIIEDYLNDTLKRAAESRLWSEHQGQDRPTAIDIQRLIR